MMKTIYSKSIRNAISFAGNAIVVAVITYVLWKAVDGGKEDLISAYVFFFVAFILMNIIKISSNIYFNFVFKLIASILIAAFITSIFALIQPMVFPNDA